MDKRILNGFLPMEQNLSVAFCPWNIISQWFFAYGTDFLSGLFAYGTEFLSGFLPMEQNFLNGFLSMEQNFSMDFCLWNRISQ